MLCRVSGLGSRLCSLGFRKFGVLCVGMLCVVSMWLMGKGRWLF